MRAAHVKAGNGTTGVVCRGDKAPGSIAVFEGECPLCGKWNLVTFIPTDDMQPDNLFECAEPRDCNTDRIVNVLAGRGNSHAHRTAHDSAIPPLGQLPLPNMPTVKK